MNQLQITMVKEKKTNVFGVLNLSKEDHRKNLNEI